jgi:hypothetical protein
LKNCDYEFNTEIRKITHRNDFIVSFTYHTIGGTLEIVKQQIILSNRERFDILELRIKHRLKFFSYTYRISDKYGTARPIIRWDNYEGQIHYDTFDTNQRLFVQKPCQYKPPKEILQLIKIFKHNLPNMEIDQL